MLVLDNKLRERRQSHAESESQRHHHKLRAAGHREPLVLISYLAADSACYAFQVAEYAKHFTCISGDLRGAGESDKPDGTCSTELFADDVEAFMRAVGIDRAHVSGISLGAAVGMWLAAKYPEKVKTLSLHSAWPRTDPFQRDLVQGWQALAEGLQSVSERIILGIFPWCLTPELYASRPKYIGALADVDRADNTNHWTRSCAGPAPCLITTWRPRWGGSKRKLRPH